MTIDEVVWLICMFKKVKPAMIPWENIREAGRIGLKPWVWKRSCA